MDLATIDNRALTVLKERPDKLTPVQRREARTGATRVVAGFDIVNENTERANLDAMVAETNKIVSDYLEGRELLRARLSKAGLTPLAIVPSAFWGEITGNLFTYSPDSESRVRINGAAVTNWLSARLVAFPTNMMAEAINANALSDWAGFLRVAQVPATHPLLSRLVLPTPPANVAEVLVKAADLGLTLKVAAVAEAVSFGESPAEIVFRHAKNEAARAEAVRVAEVARLQAASDEAARREAWLHDPIVFVEDHNVVAVLAQFGDFPIEQAIVDRAVQTDLIVPRGVNAAKAFASILDPKPKKAKVSKDAETPADALAALVAELSLQKGRPRLDFWNVPRV